MPGWKAYALTFAPVSKDPTEGDGTKKKLTNRKKRTRAIQMVFFGYVFFMVSPANLLNPRFRSYNKAIGMPCLVPCNYSQFTVS